MTVRYLALDDYLAIAVEVTGQQVEILINAAKTDLADSALHAPAASFAGEEFYSDFVDKAAVLIVRLAKNHPLPDGNKRAASPNPASPSAERRNQGERSFGARAPMPDRL